jgi:hypothetical protein
MRLVDLICEELRVDHQNLMLLRHSNHNIGILTNLFGALNNAVEEYTFIQPDKTRYDFRRPEDNPIKVVVVIVYDHVHAVYCIEGVEAAGMYRGLASPPLQQYCDNFFPDEHLENLPARRYRMRAEPSRAVGRPVSGWIAPIQAVARPGEVMFERVEVDIPDISLNPPNNDIETDSTKGELHHESQESFPEGRRIEVKHMRRERNAALVREAKRRAKETDSNGRLLCKCCGFDFQAIYGPLGDDYIEAHHTLPLSELSSEGAETKVEDLALVCANCHRMLHRRRPWLTKDELHLLIPVE